MSVRQQYDSNVFGRTDAEASPVTRVGANIIAERSSEYGHLKLESAVSARKVWEFPDLDTVDPSASYDVLGRLSWRLAVFSSGTYAKYSRLDDLEVSVLEVCRAVGGSQPASASLSQTGSCRPQRCRCPGCASRCFGRWQTTHERSKLSP